MTVLEGKPLAERIQRQVRDGVEELLDRTGRVPGLAVVLIGDDPASRVYVSRKAKACRNVGIASRTIQLDADADEAFVLNRIDELNADADVHGILVQLPLPQHISTERVLDRIRADKDADGFHVHNVGRLVTGRPCVAPCTPLGIVRLLDEYAVPIEGRRAVVVGRSNIVGKPLLHMLLARHATVTLAHSRTRDLPALCREADILVAAVGRARFIGGDFVKDGAAVVDVGINRREDGSLTGDVAYEEAARRAAWITPVPGGVGPLTIAMLMSNTLDLAREAK